MIFNSWNISIGIGIESSKDRSGGCKEWPDAKIIEGGDARFEEEK